MERRLHLVSYKNMPRTDAVNNNAFTVSKVVNEVSKNVFLTFEKVCHGGRLVTEQDVQRVRLETSNKLRGYKFTLPPSFRSIDPIFYDQSKRSFEYMVSSIDSSIRVFQSKFNSGVFNYCSCVGFANFVQMKNWAETKANPHCPRCRNTAIASLSFELEEQTKALESEIDQLN
jgi:hypothetical protein